jgi:hypothetical protein
LKEHYLRRDQISAQGTGQGGIATGAIALDILGIIASFCPGAGTAVSAVSGAASSVLRFVMGWKEDGLDGGDFLDLALNVGTDALSLVNPAAKFAKVSRGLAVALPVFSAIWSGFDQGT